MSEKIYSTTELGKMFGVTRATILNWIKYDIIKKENFMLLPNKRIKFSERQVNQIKKDLL